MLQLVGLHKLRESKLLHSHLSVRVSSKLEGPEGKSQGLVCPGNEVRGRQVLLAVQHTTTDMNDNNMDTQETVNTLTSAFKGTKLSYFMWTYTTFLFLVTHPSNTQSHTHTLCSTFHNTHPKLSTMLYFRDDLEPLDGVA